MPLQPRARKVAYSISVISAGACRPPLAPTLQSASESLAPRSGCPADPSARCTCGTPSWTGYSRAPQRAEARKRARPSGCVLASSLAAIFPAESGDARLVELSAPSLSCSSSFVNSPHARLPGMVCVAVAVLALAATGASRCPPLGLSVSTFPCGALTHAPALKSRSLRFFDEHAAPRQAPELVRLCDTGRRRLARHCPECPRWKRDRRLQQLGQLAAGEFTLHVTGPCDAS